LKVTIALPTFNEELALPRLFQSFQRDLVGMDYQVLVVDDGSRDRTASVCRQYEDRLPVTLVSHPRNLGLAAAIRTCLREGSARSGDKDWVITMDADDTHPPSLIRSMPLARDFNLCVASRFVSGAKVHGVPRMREALSKVVSTLFCVAFPVPGITDYSSGYRAYRGDLLKAAIAHHGDSLIESTGFAVQVEILFKLRRLGLRSSEVPLELHYERKPTPSAARMGHTVVDLLKVIARDIRSRFVV